MRIPEGRSAARWRRVAAAGLVLLLASLVPSPLVRRPTFSRYGPDKLLHLLGHAWFTALLAAALRGDRRTDLRTAALCVGVSTGYSLLTGHLQRWVPGRAPERADVVAAAIGSAVGLLVGRRAVHGGAGPAD